MNESTIQVQTQKMKWNDNDVRKRNAIRYRWLFIDKFIYIFIISVKMKKNDCFLLLIDVARIYGISTRTDKPNHHFDSLSEYAWDVQLETTQSTNATWRIFQFNEFIYSVFYGNQFGITIKTVFVNRTEIHISKYRKIYCLRASTRTNGLFFEEKMREHLMMNTYCLDFDFIGRTTKRAELFRLQRKEEEQRKKLQRADWMAWLKCILFLFASVSKHSSWKRNKMRKKRVEIEKWKLTVWIYLRVLLTHVISIFISLYFFFQFHFDPVFCAPRT